jgi:UDP-N-acetylmuramyl pentapeptide phosphotransferase/UDP-N-acetylglucosamine-1-phosphate transferase
MTPATAADFSNSLMSLITNVAFVAGGAFLASMAVTLWLVHSASKHAHLSGDTDLSGPQKFHARSVPRIGGVGIAVGLLLAALIQLFVSAGQEPPGLWILLCAVPAFASGLQEDLTKTVSPRRRLLFTALAALLGVFLLEAVINRTDIPGVDTIVAYPFVAAAVTVFAVAGVVNAVNIIDGFNGLAAMCCVLIFGSLAIVAFSVGDTPLALFSLAGAAAVIGFFVWNFPLGLIFLGDGGAYLLGFLVAEISILLIHRNLQVSPLFPLLLCIYPIFETIFSIYRKKLLRGISPGVPDGLHLHMIIYKRLVRWAVGNREAKELTRRNSMTSPYLWSLCMLSAVPAVIFWDNTPVLAAFIGLFIASYLYLYWSIIRFKSPRWLVFRK